MLFDDHSVGYIIKFRTQPILETEFDAYFEVLKNTFYSTCVLEFSPVFKLVKILFGTLYKQLLHIFGAAGGGGKYQASEVFFLYVENQLNKGQKKFTTGLQLWIYYEKELVAYHS